MWVIDLLRVLYIIARGVGAFGAIGWLPRKQIFIRQFPILLFKGLMDPRNNDTGPHQNVSLARWLTACITPKHL